MYREMRRKDRQISEDEAFKILEKCEYGFLSMVDNDSPYLVPISYVLYKNCIYFHSAIEGHKIDCISNNPKVAFCVVGDTNVIPDGFTTDYESTIVFGRASFVENIEEIKEYMNAICEKYSRDFLEEGKTYVERAIKQFKCVKIEIDHITGKARK